MGESNVAIARNKAEGFATGDAEKALRDVSPDVVYDQSQNSPEGGEFHGHEGLAQGLAEWVESWEDYSVEVVEVIAAGDDKVVVVILQRGRGKQSGAEIEWLSAYVDEIRDEQVVRITPYPSKEAALAAVGV